MINLKVQLTNLALIFIYINKKRAIHIFHHFAYYKMVYYLIFNEKKKNQIFKNQTSHNQTKCFFTTKY